MSSQRWQRATIHSPLWFGVRWPLPAGCWWTLLWPCHCCREPGSPSPRSLGSCWVYRLVSLCSCGRHDTTHPGWVWLLKQQEVQSERLCALKNVQHSIFFSAWWFTAWKNNQAWRLLVSSLVFEAAHIYWVRKEGRLFGDNARCIQTWREGDKLFDCGHSGFWNLAEGNSSRWNVSVSVNHLIGGTKYVIGCVIKRLLYLVQKLAINHWKWMNYSYFWHGDY